MIRFVTALEGLALPGIAAWAAVAPRTRADLGARLAWRDGEPRLNHLAQRGEVGVLDRSRLEWQGEGELARLALGGLRPQEASKALI